MSTAEQRGGMIPAHIISDHRAFFKGISPEGTFENSPAVYCRDSASADQVPKGRLKKGSAFSRPFGTRVRAHGFPALKRRAIFKGSFGAKTATLDCYLKIEIRHLKLPPKLGGSKN